ncbi:unnamed protein product [Coffea canephora]|uniref:DUF4408 domain-containing protein n=1 Tax=Coffea canephora TaxID=49390 RepID=A0A068U0B8_COFCA|nr:unnamed protein product [Coffea canephora]
MEAFDFDNVTPEKSSVILRCTHLRSIAKLFRIVEVFFVIILLSWTSTRLPFAVKISGEYCRHLVTIVISPLFIFLLGNLIVLTLLFKAGRILSGGQSPADINSEMETETDLYEAFVKTSDSCMNFTNLTSSPDEIEYQDKQTIFEVSRAAKIGKADGPEVSEVFSDKPSEMKAYSRSQSENFDSKRELPEEEEGNCGKLRRSETEKCRKVANPGEIPGETVYVFDELSNEEFQQTIEAFIAKQINFHREEKLAIVLPNHS